MDLRVYQAEPPGSNRFLVAYSIGRKLNRFEWHARIAFLMRTDTDQQRAYQLVRALRTEARMLFTVAQEVAATPVLEELAKRIPALLENENDEECILFEAEKAARENDLGEPCSEEQLNAIRVQMMASLITCADVLRKVFVCAENLDEKLKLAILLGEELDRGLCPSQSHRYVGSALAAENQMPASLQDYRQSPPAPKPSEKQAKLGYLKSRANTRSFTIAPPIAAHAPIPGEIAPEHDWLVNVQIYWRKLWGRPSDTGISSTDFMLDEFDGSTPAIIIKTLNQRYRQNSGQLIANDGFDSDAGTVQRCPLENCHHKNQTAEESLLGKSEWYSNGTAARELGVAKGRVTNLCKSGKLCSTGYKQTRLICPLCVHKESVALTKHRAKSLRQRLEALPESDDAVKRQFVRSNWPRRNHDEGL